MWFCELDLRTRVPYPSPTGRSMARKSSNRKRYFVDRDVQGAILLRLVTHLAVFLFVTGVFLIFIEMVAAPRDAVKNLLPRHGPTLFAMLVLAPIFIRDLCKLTNRFAGPMVRLKRAMHDLAEGREVAPVHFRQRDFWQDIASDFNRIVERVQSTNTTLDDDVNAVESNACGEIRETESVGSI